MKARSLVRPLRLNRLAEARHARQWATVGRMSRPATLRRWLRAAVIVAACLLLLPYLLTFVYAVVEPVSTVMAWRWLTGQRVERSYVPINRISPSLTLAVVIAEDGRFCGHYGIDLKEIQ